MKNSFLLFILLISISFVNAQVVETEEHLKKRNIDTLSGWEYGGVVNINFSQMHFSDNWAAGGQSSYTINGIVSMFANYKTENSSWDNTLDIGYGVLNQLNKDEGNKQQKTDDKIEFTSKYGKRASMHWYYAALLSFRSQMFKGYNYPDDSTVISDLLAPAYILGAIGMDYKPSKNFSMFAAPATGKLTIVNDDNLANAGAFGVEPAVIDTTTGAMVTPGEKSRMELGGYLKIAYKRALMENISLQSKIDLFSNYLDQPEKIDVSWELLIAMKVNEYISANITTHLVYDYDVIDEWQFKEVLGVGFSYKF